MEMSTPEALKRLAAMTDLPKLAEQVLALQTADKFRIAAMLLDKGKPELAETIGKRACQEIQLSKLLAGK